MKNYPKSSLIISTYNWASALRVVLNSVANQLVLPNEVIVADDGSRKETLELIQEMQKNFPCPLIHVWHEDKGFRLSAIRNRAILASKGDYIIQIDGDIIIERHFISDHLSFAQQDCFVTGSRMFITERKTAEVLNAPEVKISWNMHGIRQKLNGIRLKWLSNIFAFRYKKSDLFYVKGCNMAFWRQDLIEVNGYNEDIEGWGAEDSEISARLLALGKRRKFIKFGGIQFHLYHENNSRYNNDKNYQILDNIRTSRIQKCKNGIDKYSKSTPTSGS